MPVLDLGRVRNWTSVPAPRFVGWMHSDDDFAPEGVDFIPAEKSPSGRPIVVVSYEDSGTVVLWDIDL